jgi:hypothetical protein
MVMAWLAGMCPCVWCHMVLRSHGLPLSHLRLLHFKLFMSCSQFLLQRQGPPLVQCQLIL